jgi:hypothetical protein
MCRKLIEVEAATLATMDRLDENYYVSISEADSSNTGFVLLQVFDRHTNARQHIGKMSFGGRQRSDTQWLGDNNDKSREIEVIIRNKDLYWGQGIVSDGIEALGGCLRALQLDTDDVACCNLVKRGKLRTRAQGSTIYSYTQCFNGNARQRIAWHVIVVTDIFAARVHSAKLGWKPSQDFFYVVTPKARRHRDGMPCPGDYWRICSAGVRQRGLPDVFGDGIWTIHLPVVRRAVR